MNGAQEIEIGIEAYKVLQVVPLHEERDEAVIEVQLSVVCDHHLKNFIVKRSDERCRPLDS